MKDERTKESVVAMAWWRFMFSFLAATIVQRKKIVVYNNNINIPTLLPIYNRKAWIAYSKNYPLQSRQTSNCWG
jgi:hypothetical protein